MKIGIETLLISPISKLYLIFIYFTLGILCLFHLIQITTVHQQYNIQSSMDEGLAPTEYSDITAKICFRHLYDNSTVDELNTTDRILMITGSVNNFRVLNCRNPIDSSVSDDRFICIESYGNKNCSENHDFKELMSIDWKMLDMIQSLENLLNMKFYWPAHEKIEIQMSINPTDRGLFYQSPTFRIDDISDVNDYQMLYMKAEFLEYPYSTKCVDKIPRKNRLKCLEEKYILRGRDTKWQRTLTITVAATNSIDIKVSPSMTMFDYISCISTLLYWDSGLD